MTVPEGSNGGSPAGQKETKAAPFGLRSNALPLSEIENGPAVAAATSEGPGSGNSSPLRDLLAAYDRTVDASLRKAFQATTGIEKVRLLHNTVRRSIAVHDAVLRSALCPLLEDLPGGPAIADRLRRGCDERGTLLQQFDAVSRHVSAQNVYPVSGTEIDAILDGLDHSFNQHLFEETTEVGDVLEAASQSLDPEVVAVRMALESQDAPTRFHTGSARHPRSRILNRLYRNKDRRADWVAAHHGWLDHQATQLSPRTLQVNNLFGRTGATPPTVPALLAGYDETVGVFVEDVRAARTDLEELEGIQRLSAAIAIHDSVLAGVLCPLLDAVPTSKAAADRLRAGCRQRAEHQQEWRTLTEGRSAPEIYPKYRFEVATIRDALIESFSSHAELETSELSALLSQLSASAYRTNASPFGDAMRDFYSEGPELLALRMALWARSSPNRSHSLLVAHPTSRSLRSMYHLVDAWHGRLHDTALGRWAAPKTPPGPFPKP
jgi:hypothetical protein